MTDKSTGTEEYGWLALLTQHYDLTLQGEPLLLARRDGQQVFRLVTTGGRVLTLRLCPPSRPLERVLAETHLLLYLNRQAFPAPRLLPARTGQPVFEWQPGAWGYLHDFIEGQNPAWDLAVLREVAELLGRLHTLKATSEPELSRVNWLDDLQNTISRAQAAASDPKWGQRAAELAGILGSQPLLQALPVGVIHSDVHEGNLLRLPNGELFLLDWELAGVGQLLIDLAMVLGWHCVWPAPKDPTGTGPAEDFDFDEEWCKTFLANYQRIRPLTAEEVKHLAPAIRFTVGWYAVRDISFEIEEEGSSEGLAYFHWAIVHSLTPAREKQLIGWALETGAAPLD